MARIMIIMLCVLSLLAIFPGAISRAATPSTEQHSQPDGVSLAPESLSNVLSIPVAAFMPSFTEYNYENHGRYLKYFGTHSTGIFRAAVNMPQGATMTQLSFALHDDSTTENATIRLKRDALNQEAVTIAEYTTSSSTGWFQMSENFSVVVNNDANVYWLEVELPPCSTSDADGDKVWGGSGRIYYTPPEVETGILSIPASTFKRFTDNNIWFTDDARLEHLSTGRGGYLASVELPNGAVITSFALRYGENESASQINAWLQRGDSEDNYLNMANVSSINNSSEISIGTSNINNATIDKELYTYWVFLDLPQSVLFDVSYAAYGVEIEYTFPIQRMMLIRSYLYPQPPSPDFMMI